MSADYKKNILRRLKIVHSHINKVIKMVEESDKVLVS
mgnify:FL=1